MSDGGQKYLACKTEPRHEYDRGVAEGKFLLSGELSLTKAAVRELRALLIAWLNSGPMSDDDLDRLRTATEEAL